MSAKKSAKKQPQQILSSTYELPQDLKIRHYRSNQVLIMSDTTTLEDRQRIDKVKYELQSFNVTHQTTDIKTDAIKETPSIIINNTNDDDNDTSSEQLPQSTPTTTSTTIDDVSSLTSSLGDLSLIAPEISISLTQSQSVCSDSTFTLPNNSNSLLSPHEQHIISRYQRSFIQHRIQPRHIPIGTPIAKPTEDDASTPIITSIISTPLPTPPDTPIENSDNQDNIINNVDLIPENTSSTPSQQQQSTTPTPILTPTTQLTNFINSISPQSPLSSLHTTRRKKVEKFITAIQAIQQAKNIIVVMGAGLSVSCGIPDFRSENGLYELLKDIDLTSNNTFTNLHHLPNYSPEYLKGTMEDFEPTYLFAIGFFRKNPIPFYTFYYKMGLAGDLCQPSFSHKFLKVLEDKGKIRRIYTQNIDNLEKKAGLTNYVCCHGNDDKFHCIDCDLKVDTKYLTPWLKNQQIPFCHIIREFLYNEYYDKACQLTNAGLQRDEILQQVPFVESDLYRFKNSIGKIDDCKGLWKPAIVFFGESLPDEFRTKLKEDVGHSDLVLVMGTSLQVHPVASIPSTISNEHGYIGDYTGIDTLCKLKDVSKYLSKDSCVPLTRPDGEPMQIRFKNLTPLDQKFVLYNWTIEQYTLSKARTDQSTTHLHQLAMNLQHVPIISINRDSLIRPQREYYASSPGETSTATTQEALELKLSKVFRTPYTLTSFDDDECWNNDDNNNNSTTATPTSTTQQGTAEDDLSDGDFDDWIDEVFSTSKPKVKFVDTTELRRCDYEFLGNSDDVCKFIVKSLGW